ncbi:MAG: hypothetical protein HKN21_06870 [Candidatus Eisenbacteria bacterium]|uniref:PEP-CTERM sorting domain-containing protein n=1 Tax=Eiseniibacteriota bacterium TaxID=2212470 RepID=A0A7Y2EAN7_UNCEI|nr:hypothetical protein [Candidatus Eisenbacteria bacterium]
MLRRITMLLMFACLVSVGTAQADINVTIDPADFTFGYMIVYNLPADGGAYQFEGGWGFSDLVATFSGSDLTLSPNTIGDPNEYWYKCVGSAVPPNCGGPGAPGNKCMEAIGHAQIDDGSLSGDNVIFSGEVLANSFTQAHTVTAFIRDFAPDFSSFNETQLPLNAIGPFSLSLATIADPTRHVQYGFITKGENVWVTDTGPFGSMTIGPVGPTPTEDTTWGGIKTVLGN